jgi:hypothetical protein
MTRRYGPAVHAAHRAMRIAEANRPTQEDYTLFMDEIMPILREEHAHMREQGYIFPFQNVENSLRVAGWMERERHHLVYTNPRDFIVRHMVMAHKNEGRAGVISKFTGLMDETNQFTVSTVMKSRQGATALMHEGTAQIARLQDDIDTKQAKLDATGWRARLANAFDWTDIAKKEAEIEAVVAAKGGSLKYSVGTEKDETHPATKDQFLFIGENHGIPFKGIPGDYLANRFKALGIEPPAPAAVA